MKLLAALTVVALAPAIRSCTPADPPPVVAVTATICDITRCPDGERASFGVWGPEGHVEATMRCLTRPIATPTWWVDASSGDRYFPGGGTSTRPAMYVTVACPPTVPYHWRGSASARSWS
jgi:hypothetical protein